MWPGDWRRYVTDDRLPSLRRPKAVVGPRLRFRDASPEDAEFILGLRLDPSKNTFLSSTSADLTAQKNWLGRYVSDTGQVYFIIEDHEGRSFGTVRIYDVIGASFSWGSWILSDDAPRSSAVETTLMVYAFGMACGFDAAHFEVRIGNRKVWEYHERFGAKRIAEDDLNFYYSIDRGAIEASMERYRERIPSGVQVQWD